MTSAEIPAGTDTVLAKRVTRSRVNSSKSTLRSIALLSLAAFASAATLRVADPLLPQVAADFDASVGAASIISTSFAVAYGACQLLYGPLGDRFGKYRVITLATLLSAVTVTASAFAHSLSALALFRFASGCTAAGIVPLSMAYVGDVVDYDRRQTVLARFLSGFMLGIVGGQVFGGLVSATFGWRGVFVVLGTAYFLIAIALYGTLRSGIAAQSPPPSSSAGALSRYIALLTSSEARGVIVTAFCQAFLFFGGFAYIGAYCRQTFGISYVAVGALLGCYGLGGLIYAISVKTLVRRFGERGVVLGGGIVLMASLCSIAWLTAAELPFALTASGVGSYMVMNTLQTRATQMAPDARGLAVSLYAASLFLGQAAGVAFCGLLIDAIGYAPVFVGSGVALLILAVVFRGRLSS